MKRILLLFIVATFISCSGDTHEIASPMFVIENIEGEYNQLINRDSDNTWDDTPIKFTEKFTYEHGVRYIGDYSYSYPQTSIYWKDVQGNIDSYHDFDTKWYCDGQIVVLSYKEGSADYGHDYGVYKRVGYNYSADLAFESKFCNN